MHGPCGVLLVDEPTGAVPGSINTFLDLFSQFARILQPWGQLRLEGYQAIADPYLVKSKASHKDKLILPG